MGRATVNLMPLLRSAELDIKRPLDWAASYTEGGCYDESIPNSTTNQGMNMMSVSSAALALVSAKDGPVTVRFNASTGTAFSLPLGGIAMIAGAPVTSVHVTNLSGAAVVVRVMIAG